MYAATPYHPSLGPLRFETDLTQETPRVVLQMPADNDGITLPLLKMRA